MWVPSDRFESTPTPIGKLTIAQIRSLYTKQRETGGNVYSLFVESLSAFDIIMSTQVESSSLYEEAADCI